MDETQMKWSKTDTMFFDYLEGVESLFNDPKYSDLTIVCQDRKFHTHRVILCTQSQFFKAACNESSREAQIGVIHLDNDDPVGVERMLRYYYTGKIFNEDDQDPDLLDIYCMVRNMIKRHHGMDDVAERTQFEIKGKLNGLDDVEVLKTWIERVWRDMPMLKDYDVYLRNSLLLRVEHLAQHSLRGRISKRPLEVLLEQTPAFTIYYVKYKGLGKKVKLNTTSEQD